MHGRSRPARSLALPLALGLALAAAGHAAGTNFPTLTTITVDGDTADWSEILANPVNTSRDDHGSAAPCISSSDRDCPVDATEHDLLRFAWTMDDTNLFFYFERASSSFTTDYLVVYLDIDRDGLMEATDQVLSLRLPSGSSSVTSEVFDYVPQGNPGDPLADGSGMADGWTLPGGVAGGRSNVAVGQGIAIGGAVYEVAIPWNRLGVADWSPMFFHVSAATGGQIPADVQDNMGGPGGLVGDTGWRAVRVGPDRVTGAAPGGVASLRHYVFNACNLAGTIAMWARSQAALDIAWSLDADQDGTCEAPLAVDAGGDGVFTLPGDSLFAGADSDSDGLPDLGLVPLGGWGWICLDIAIPSTAGGLIDTIDVFAAHGEDRSAQDQAADLVRVGDVTIVRDEVRTGVAGQVAWFPHVVEENLGAAALANFSVVSIQGWTWSFFTDPDGDGRPADAVLLTDTDGDGRADMPLAAGEIRPILARATIPAIASLGQQETAFVRVHLDGPPLCAVTDRLVVGNPHAVVPDYVLADGNARYGSAGGPIYFAHRLINGGSTTPSFDLSASSDVGWPVAILTDPDGDGRPFDAAPPAAGPVQVAFNGGEYRFIVRVDVPAGTRVGDIARITVRAADAADPADYVEAYADAVAALVRVYDDAAHIVNVPRVPACGTAYCLATGLPPSSAGYRFQWRDPADMLVRVIDASTDPAGQCPDEMMFGAADGGAGWTVAIQRDEGGAWVTLDVAMFAIGDAVEAVALTTGAPTCDLRDTRLSATLDVRNASSETSVAGMAVRWTVLTPDRSQLLAGSGAFVRYSGTEATRTEIVDLMPGQQRALALDVSGIAFPIVGDYPIEVWRMTTCGSESLLAAGTFRVVDDADGDGLERGDELAAGLDPDDPDSDDDGLQDGADGLIDSDGDGLIDALDCDSDGDGLPDGLEAGVSTAGPGTDVARGCFRADADPTTITDPDVADTDGGGATDGSEDANGNGRIDAGERDPVVALDDAAGCSTSVPAEVLDLMVRRAGGDAVLSWDATRDPCTTWRVEAADVLPSFTSLVRGLDAASHADGTPLGPDGIRFYLVRAESWLAGIGP